MTIIELSKTSGISRFTLAHAAKNGTLGQSATQSGATWLIDTNHADYQTWLARYNVKSHKLRGRHVKAIEKKIAERK